MKNTEWELKEFMEKIALEAGYKYVKALDMFVEQELATKIIGRMIVWSAKNEHLLIGKLLSRVMGLEIQIEKSPIDLKTHWRIIYAKRCIAEQRFGIDFEINSSALSTSLRH